jgi:hypothetical protein
MIDASNDVGGGSAALEIRPNNFRAQSFTATSGGLLSRVDVQVGKFAGATGDVRFELRPLVGGFPTTDDRGMLFMSTININDIPVINSLADPPPFVSVDVTSAGIHAQPGEQFAISLRRSGGSPAAAWRSRPNSYAGGAGFFRSLLTSPWSNSAEEYGFQSWIDPTPSAPYKLRIDPTFDMTYRPGAVSSLIEGEQETYVGGIPGSTQLPEQRPVMEFSLANLPAGAIIQGAHLDLDFYVSSGAPRIEITGFAGDGLASFADATSTGTQLTITGPTNATSPPELSLSASYIDALRGQASHVGLRLRGLDGSQYVGFTLSEDDSTVTLPPRLVIEYTLLPGDFNQDGAVDGADYVVWRKTDGTQQQFNIWRANFGAGTGGSGQHSGLSTGASVPEPTGIMLLVAVVIVVGWTRRGYPAKGCFPSPASWTVEGHGESIKVRQG